ncbi:peptidoglycan-binding domain-containing protein [Pantanalinema rosaneae CENA516]|uniref:peptidoglycan-binding domain-containing protein n=1 Tax=Pantanalinema rosaneae TaxID=1620701 RepID=UPI003D6F39B5
MTTTIQTNKPILQLGSQGAAVKELQTLINKFLNAARLKVDGIFGTQTLGAVKEMQERFFLTVDGIVGAKTWAALIAGKNTELPVLKVGSQGDLVRRVQSRLAVNGYTFGTIDGIFGIKTEATVKRFQVDRNLQSDGIIGQQTWVQLSYLYPYSQR